MLRLPDGLTEIADNAFWDCEALSAVALRRIIAGGYA